jgi:NADPH2:quinone reductase
MMQAVEITAPGAPDVLQLGSRALPTLKPGELLIQVAAAGINRPDVEQRKGAYPPPPGASDIPGLEVAGTVVAMAEDVRGWQLGDAVCALVSGGGYAEYCSAPALQCLPVPKGLSMAEAAALPETFFTVWHNVFDRVGLKRGENFLVHGGTSGIGTTAIQLAHVFGARVFATAGSARKCEVCVALGADRAINYKTEDFVEVCKAESNKAGMQVILDMVGGSYLARNMSALGIEGRMALIALMGGRESNVNLGIMLMKRLTITGSALRPRSVAEKGAIAASLREKVWPLIEAGKVKPVIDSVLPLAQAAAAHARMESSEHIGKIVLQLQ